MHLKPKKKQQIQGKYTKKSRYNLYMSDTMKWGEVKMKDVPSWKSLPESKRKKWNDKAISENKKG